MTQICQHRYVPEIWRFTEGSPLVVVIQFPVKPWTAQSEVTINSPHVLLLYGNVILVFDYLNSPLMCCFWASSWVAGSLSMLHWVLHLPCLPAHSFCCCSSCFYMASLETGFLSLNMREPCCHKSLIWVQIITLHVCWVCASVQGGLHVVARYYFLDSPW